MECRVGSDLGTEFRSIPGEIFRRTGCLERVNFWRLERQMEAGGRIRPGQSFVSLVGKASF